MNERVRASSQEESQERNAHASDEAVVVGAFEHAPEVSIEDERREVELAERACSTELTRMSIGDVLREYHIEAQWREREDGMLEFEHGEVLPRLPDLPDGYVFVGGAARALLLAALGRYVQAPRDIDIAWTGKPEEVDSETARSLAQRYNPGDYAHGYGVQFMNESYFSTRDFTINEVYADRGSIICTRQCLLDTVRNIIRITDREHDEEGAIREKIAAKALRFVVEAIRRGHDVSLAEDIRDVYIKPFFIALQLERAYELGDETAERYVQELRERFVLPEEVMSVADAVEYLLHSTTFVFRSVPVRELLMESRIRQKYPEQE